VLVAEKQFLQNIIKKYGKHPVSSDRGTWYVPACKFLKLKHHINSSCEKSTIIESIIQYIKDRTQNFDNYFPCNKNKCKLEHVVN
jgi:putative transposase